MNQKTKEEYYFLTEKLEETQWALEGKCNDIDCDKYMYKDLLKKRYKPVLKHDFSCMKRLKMEKEAYLRILSDEKYSKYRYLKCEVCRKKLDKLGEKSNIVGFTKPIDRGGKTYYLWNGIWTHKKCSPKVKIPEGWKGS